MTFAALAGLVARLDTVALALVLCSETQGLERRVGEARAGIERAAIGQVAMVRAQTARRPLSAVLLAPRQFATTCPPRAALDFSAFAADFLAGRIRPPSWSRRAAAFATPYAARKVARKWRRWGWVPIRGTGTVHVFFERR